MSSSGLPASLRTFRHGVHPREGKDATAHLAVERMPYVEEYVLPLAQHIGAPSVAVVLPGDKVHRGQMIAKPDGFVSVGLHAPVTGTVKALELRPHPSGKRMPSIVIRTDPYASQRWHATPVAGAVNLSPADVVRRVQEAGLVGLGGAAFPSHVKLKVPEGKKVRFVVLNGCECEPYLTCDHRVMVERAPEVIRGLRTIMRQVAAERAYIGVEANKPDAVAALTAAAGPSQDIEVIGLQVKYPQGAEKMLIQAVFKREVPSGKLPLDLEMLVNNVGTAVSLAELFEQSMPLIERVVTVTGPGIRRPANLLVPIGTPVSAVIDHCGGLLPDTRQVILGGPMMGAAQKDLSIPIVKGASGILALTSAPVESAGEELACVRCGKCLEACPMFLNPSRLQWMSRAEMVDGLKSHAVMDCFECGSCAFACPSRIPLVQWIRTGKVLVRQQKAVA